MASQATAVMAPAATGRRRRVKRWFYISAGLFMVLFTIVGFGPSIIDQSRRNVPLPLTPLVTAHAIASSAWLLLFLTQATLVAVGRTAVHRRVGIAGVVLTVAFVVLGWFTIIEQARRGFDLSGANGPVPPAPAANPAPVALIGGNVLPFAVLAGVGLWCRNRPDVHKRLMLLAMLGGLTATPLAHLIGAWPALQPWAGVLFSVTPIVFLSLSAIYDRVSQGRVHPVSLWGAILVFTWVSLFFSVVGPSSAWQDFAAWLIR